MKMQVETFEDTDVRAETTEQSAEALALIKELGLEGQLAKADTSTETETRFPYRLITNEELFIYSQLCPSKSEATRYDMSPMPIEVLKALHFAKSFNLLKSFYVWSADSSKTKDPVLVGFESAYGSGRCYILARWGEELLPLQVMLPDAIRVWYASRVDKLNEIIAECRTALAQPAPIGIPKNTSAPSFYLD